MVWLPDNEKNSNICLSVLTWSTNVKKSPFSRTAAHIFVFPGDAPATITQYVAWMERQFNACQTLRSMYLSIYNSFRVIPCSSQCVSRKIAILPHFCFPWGAPGAITLNVVWMEREFDAYKLSCSMYPSIFNSFPVIRTASAKIAVFTYRSPHFCFPWGRPLDNHAKCLCMEREFDAYKLSRCMCPSKYSRFWDTARYLWKIGILSYPFAFDAPVRGVPVGISAPPLVRKN